MRTIALEYLSIFYIMNIQKFGWGGVGAALAYSSFYLLIFGGVDTGKLANVTSLS